MFRRLLFSVVLLVATLSFAKAQPSLTVFAAASLQEAMEKIGAAFEEETGVNVVFSFAGTGTLARQVEAGAPADLFVSADTAWMDYVKERGAVQADTIIEIASNALVLIGPDDSQKLDLAELNLASLLSDGRLAIAEPETVPAGRYGKAALEQLGLWQSVTGHLAPMENVRIVLTSVARGDVPVGLVYQTDALVEPGVAVIAEIPSTSHPEILYLAAVTGIRSNPAAADLLIYLTSPRSREILRSHGFVTDKVD
jgi:molybdate transport system substrate-binding protein